MVSNEGAAGTAVATPTATTPATATMAAGSAPPPASPPEPQGAANGSTSVLPPGAPPTNALTAEPSAPPTLPEWPKLIEALPEALREEAARSVNLQGLVERVVEMRKALSKAREGYVPAPRENMSEAERAQLRKALGVPEKPEGYALSLPPEQMADPDTKERLGRFAAAMHEAGAPRAVAEAAVKFHVEETQRLAEAEAARLAETVQRTIQTLRAEWGAEYDRLRGVARAAANWAFGEDGFRVLEASGALAHAEVVKGLAKLGAQLGESLPEIAASRAEQRSEWQAIQAEAIERMHKGTYTDPEFQRRYVEAARRLTGGQ